VMMFSFLDEMFAFSSWNYVY